MSLPGQAGDQDPADYEQDDDDRDDDCEPCVDEDDSIRNRCVLGEACLVADPFHTADECFDVEWAEMYFGTPEPSDG